jgi:hypothetical protein
LKFYLLSTYSQGFYSQILILLCLFNEILSVLAGSHYFSVSTVKTSIMSVRRSKHALLMGPDFDDLGTGPTNNCMTLKSALERADQSWSVTLLTGKQATKAAILSAVKILVQQANAAPAVSGFGGEQVAPVVFVFFAGHAGQSGSEQYLVPYLPNPVADQVLV